MLNLDTKIPQLQNILIFANTLKEIMNKKNTANLRLYDCVNLYRFISLCS